MSDEPSDAQKLILEALSDAIAKSFVGVGEFVIDRQRVARIDGRVDLRAVAAEVDKALGGLTRVWSVAGDCRLSPGKDCDHFGEHGPWTCEAEAETREEAEAFPIARQPDAHIKSRFVSGWTVTE
ncbi:Uncharacterised protein [Mycobacteroides abscessus subsp. abscessus]|nr:Uncharacterised protein [Mycobacteroides abscessus subsp. abscessus]